MPKFFNGSHLEETPDAPDELPEVVRNTTAGSALDLIGGEPTLPVVPPPVGLDNTLKPTPADELTLPPEALEAHNAALAAAGGSDPVTEGAGHQPPAEAPQPAKRSGK